MAPAFGHCGLSVVAFEARSRTRGIEKFAFVSTDGSVEFIDGSAFCGTEGSVFMIKLIAFRFACDGDLRVDRSGKSSLRYCGISADPLISGRFTELASGCFDDCHDIMALTFGRGCSISQFGKHAFEGRVKLGPIVDPKLIKILGKPCFRLCHSLQILLFPCGSRLRHIEKSILRGCST
jgi:hypothetical protein